MFGAEDVINPLFILEFSSVISFYSSGRLFFSFAGEGSRLSGGGGSLTVAMVPCEHPEFLFQHQPLVGGKKKF